MVTGTWREHPELVDRIEMQQVEWTDKVEGDAKVRLVRRKRGELEEVLYRSIDGQEEAEG